MRPVTAKYKSDRGTIFVEEARVLSHEAHGGNQYSMRLAASKTAACALPGQFVHLTCDPALPMRRPMSLMRVSPESGWIDILFKVHGKGTALLAQCKPSEFLSLMGPIGVPFKLGAYRRRPLLIGGGVGIPPMVFLAEHIKKQGGSLKPFVLMGSEAPFPFKPRPSRFLVPGIPPEVIAAMPLMEDWGLPSRLASFQGFPGCFEGYVTDLARIWFDALVDEDRQAVEIFACGPTLMLKAVAMLAKEYALPCQISLEEYMACAVGGCAGCAVRIETDKEPAMKRVCVDGPVFDAATVMFQ